MAGIRLDPAVEQALEEIGVALTHAAADYPSCWNRQRSIASLADHVKCLSL
jgi:hypothetical protein